MGVRGSVLTVLAPALVLALVAAACTSAPAEPDEATPSDAGADQGDTTPTADQPTAPSSPPSSATTTTEPPVEDRSTLDPDELLAVWAADRAAAVERITAAGVGHVGLRGAVPTGRGADHRQLARRCGGRLVGPPPSLGPRR